MRNRLTKKAMGLNDSPTTMHTERRNPDIGKYETGNPSAWAEDPHMESPWDLENSQGREDTGHAKKVREDGPMYTYASAIKEAKDMEEKALRCLKMAEVLLGDETPADVLERQAVDFMTMSNKSVTASLRRMREFEEQINSTKVAKIVDAVLEVIAEEEEEEDEAKMHEAGKKEEEEKEMKEDMKEAKKEEEEEEACADEDMKEASEEDEDAKIAAIVEATLEVLAEEEEEDEAGEDMKEAKKEDEEEKEMKEDMKEASESDLETKIAEIVAQTLKTMQAGKKDEEEKEMKEDMKEAKKEEEEEEAGEDMKEAKKEDEEEKEMKEDMKEAKEEEEEEKEMKEDMKEASSAFDVSFDEGKEVLASDEDVALLSEMFTKDAGAETSQKDSKIQSLKNVTASTDTKSEIEKLSDLWD